MSQYFLPPAQARTLLVCRVFEMNEEQAFKVFKKVRWGDGKEVTCPMCGMVTDHYFIDICKQWGCKDCSHTFGVTSETIFAFHKLSLKMYLAAIAIYTNAVKDFVRLLGASFQYFLSTRQNLLTLCYGSPKRRTGGLLNVRRNF